MLEHVEIKEGILNNPIYDYLYSVEEVNKYGSFGYDF